MKLKSVITSQNCTVLFNDIEVGYLQNLSINCTYNLTPIKNLHQFEIQNYAQGIATYSATAQRGFVSLSDTLFGGQTGLLELYNLSKDVKKGFEENSSAGDKYRMLANLGLLLNKATEFATDTLGQIGDLLQGKKNDETGLSDLFALFDYFDIIIKNPIVDFPMSEPISAIVDKLVGSQTNLIKLKNCKFNARSLNFSTSNVAVMENINIVARELSDYTNKIVNTD